MLRLGLGFGLGSCLEIWTGVEWSVNGQWKKMPGVDVRLMEHAEHDDEDEMYASLVVVGSHVWTSRSRT